MFTFSPVHRLASLTTFVALTAGAQTAPAPASKPVPNQSALPYHSAMEGYKAFADEKPVPWAAANTTVDQRGGWRAYAKEASGDSQDEKSVPADGVSHTKPAATEKKP
jgi:hypothetical protein